MISLSSLIWVAVSQSSLGMTPGLKIVEGLIVTAPRGPRIVVRNYFEQKAKDMWARFKRNPARSDLGAAAFILRTLYDPYFGGGRAGRFGLDVSDTYAFVTSPKFGDFRQDPDRVYLAMCALYQDGRPNVPPNIVEKVGTLQVVLNGKLQTVPSNIIGINPIIEAEIERLYAGLAKRFPGCYYFRIAKAAYAPWREGYRLAKLLLEENRVVFAISAVRIMNVRASLLKDNSLLAEAASTERQLQNELPWTRFVDASQSLVVGTQSRETRELAFEKPPGGVPGWPRVR